MNAPFSIDPGATSPMRSHGEVAHYTLALLWRAKWFMAGIVIGSALLAGVSTALIPTQYTSDAVIQLNFNREEPATGSRTRLVANLDAPALMDSEVRLIRARTTALAVVASLGLASDADFTQQSRVSRALLWLRAALGGTVPEAPTPDDLAVATLMQRVRVESQARSYLIAISITSPSPETSLLLANAVATEYLRATAIRDRAEQEMRAQAEFSALAATYGERHPSFQQALSRIEENRTRVQSLRASRSAAEIVALAGGGPTLIPAEANRIPSGPNAQLLMGAAAVIGLVMAVFLVLARDRLRERRKNPLLA